MPANEPGFKKDSQGKIERATFNFAGMNNIIDPADIDISKGEVIDGLNVDFNTMNNVSVRDGYSQVTSGTFYHSGWNNITRTRAYFVSNSIIYEWDGVNPPIALLTLSNNNQVEFCQVNNAVAYSNGVDFGIFGDNFTQTRTYSSQFKAATLGGRCLEFYNGRLYFSRVNSLYCTDTFDVQHVDVRWNRVAIFPHAITMCKFVDDGLVIGTTEYLYFLKGDDILTGGMAYTSRAGFKEHILAKAGVIYGSVVKINSEYMPEAQGIESLVVFLTTKGICSVANDGKYMNHSYNTVSFDVGQWSTGFVRIVEGSPYYTVCFKQDSEIDYTPYSITSNIYDDIT